MGKKEDRLLSSSARRRAQVFNARESFRLKEMCSAVDRMKYVRENGYRKEKEVLEQTLTNLRSSHITLPDIGADRKLPRCAKPLTRKSSAPGLLFGLPRDVASARSSVRSVQAKRKTSEPVQGSMMVTPRRQRATVESDIDEVQRKSFTRETIGPRRLSVVNSEMEFIENKLKRSTSVLIDLEKLKSVEARAKSPSRKNSSVSFNESDEEQHQPT